VARGASLFPVRTALRRPRPARFAQALSRAWRLPSHAVDGGCRPDAAAEAAAARDAAFARGDERRPLSQRRLCIAFTAQSLLHGTLLPSRAAPRAGAALWVRSQHVVAAPSTRHASSSWPRARAQGSPSGGLLRASVRSPQRSSIAPASRIR